MPERIVAAQELAALLGVLAHPDRIRIVEELSVRGDQEVRELREHLEIPASRMSQHLTLLKRYRILREHKDGRKVLYHLQFPELARWLVGGFAFLTADGFTDTLETALEYWQLVP